MGPSPVAATITVGPDVANKTFGTMGYTGSDRCQLALAGFMATFKLAAVGTVTTGGLVSY